ncbi:MAG: hypothetical protein ACPGJE_08505, partial [Wenzhouxiangellaceae bacterium]
GDSWLSEATIQFSNSSGSADPNAINLTVGAGEDTPGDQDFSSGGAIIDFSDNGLPDVTAGADGILRLQLFEGFDDNPDAIDAVYRETNSPAPCDGLLLACTGLPDCRPPRRPQLVPLDSPWALTLLVVLLAGTGAFTLRRFT